MIPSNNRCCDICGADIPSGVVAFVHWDYLYCPRCEEIHRRNEREAAVYMKGKRG